MLSKVAKEIYPGDVAVWERWRDTLSDFSELNRLHWSEQLQQYADIGINAPEVALGSFAIDKKSNFKWFRNGPLIELRQLERR